MEEEHRQAASAAAQAASHIEGLQQRLRQAGAELASRTAELGAARVHHQDALSRITQLEVFALTPTAPVSQRGTGSQYSIRVCRGPCPVLDAPRRFSVWGAAFRGRTGGGWVGKIAVSRGHGLAYGATKWVALFPSSSKADAHSFTS